jgi:hypothetical protein
MKMRQFILQSKCAFNVRFPLDEANFICFFSDVFGLQNQEVGARNQQQERVIQNAEENVGESENFARKQQHLIKRLFILGLFDLLIIVNFLRL